MSGSRPAAEGTEAQAEALASTLGAAATCSVGSGRAAQL